MNPFAAASSIPAASRSTAASNTTAPQIGPADQLGFAQQILRTEAEALLTLARQLGGEFCRAAELLFHCSGSAIVSGMGKAGLIGHKIAATLASTGTRSHYLHPGEALHGDLGRVHRDDVVLMLSQSGETDEIVRLLPSLAELGVPLIAITARRTSKLGRAARVVIELGPLLEACSLGLAPSTSTTAMLALGDALALVVSRMRGFDREDFYRFHPAGNLGRKLAKVEEHMRPLADCRVASCSKTVRQIFTERRLPGRRTGAVMVVDPQGILRGIFTDSDLARLLESRRDEAIDGAIRAVMTKRPASVGQGTMLLDAVQIMADRKISELPVVDAAGRPIGLVDITDVVGLMPGETLPGEVLPGETLPSAAAEGAATAASNGAVAPPPTLQSTTSPATVRGGIVPRPKSAAFGTFREPSQPTDA